MTCLLTYRVLLMVLNMQVSGYIHQVFTFRFKKAAHAELASVLIDTINDKPHLHQNLGKSKQVHLEIQ